MRYWDEYWLCGPGSYFHGPFGFLINLAFWIGLFLIGAWLLRSLTTSRSRRDHESTAVEILKRRYARGEIERSEFEEKLQDLS